MGAIYDLINTNGLGHLKVLIQEKNTTVKAYNKLERHQEMVGKKLPMQTTAHLNIAQAKYPHTIVENPLW